MTERASPSPESRRTAISRFFGGAMLSLRLLFSVSILALSGAPRQLSQRESHWAKRAGFTGCKSLSPWERWHRASDDGEGKPVSREPPHSDKQVLWRSDAIAAPALLRQHPCPLRRSAPALPKGEPLAGRATSYWTLKARYGAKGRALLQRAAASGQRTLSSCCESWQRSTTVFG